MRKILLLFCCWSFAKALQAQQLSAAKLIDMSASTVAKIESQLLSKKYHSIGSSSFSDTLVRTFQYRPAFKSSKKKQADSVSRRVAIASLKETFTITYQTTLQSEHAALIEALKKDSFRCEYEKDTTVAVTSHFYQHEDYTADATTKEEDGLTWYCITFFKKELPVNKNLHFAEDLLEFTSHEYLVFYFGEKNVKKDVYYFSRNDIVKCSVLFANTKRQVIFIWKDGLNRRKLDNILIGGAHKLQSQEGDNGFTAENDWILKNSVRPGMPIFELRAMNEGNFSFCGGDSPNPGLILPQTQGRIDFKNVDIILGCMNCTDDKYLNSQVMYADRAMEDARILFVLTIVLYPEPNGLFN